MAYKITGNWSRGLAFDQHTLSSSYLGVDQFGHDRWETTRSEMGELVYQLKYRENTGSIARIVELLGRIKGIEEFDRIVPIPPTDTNRQLQPVKLIAEALGKDREVEVIPDLLSKNPGGQELKNVTDPAERQKLLRESMTLSDEYDIAGLKILLVDDLYRSGATLSLAAELLLNEGKVERVSVLTMTKTRSNR